ncbi:MAG: hypothetical protein U0R52_00825 [Solirubrobacterales bacterium]
MPAQTSPHQPAVPRRAGRRCAPRARQPGDLRPTDVVGAFFVGGIAFLLAAAAAGAVEALDPWPWGRWLALHLAFVGGVSQLVLGASQFFVGAFLATDPPPRRLVRAQLAAWNAGAVGLAVGVPLSSAPLTWGSVALLLAALGLYAAGLAGMRRRSLRQAPWATRWYASGAAFLAVGIVIGAMLARGVLWTEGDLLAAHMALNLGGWFGAAIVGTLHTFYPSLTSTELARPRLQDLALGAWLGGVVALAAGYAWSVESLAVAGWLGLVAGALALLFNVAASWRKAPRPLLLPARLVGAGQVFLLAGLLVALVAAIDRGPALAVAGSTRAAVGTLLVAGWVGLTVVGSLLHLLAVMVRVRDFSTAMPAPRPATDRAVALLAAAGVIAVALAQLGAAGALGEAASAVLLASYLILGGMVIRLAGRVLLRARPSI